SPAGHRRPGLLLSSAFLFSSLALAQVAPNAPDPAPASNKAKPAIPTADEVVQLTPFEVSATDDKGYYASSTMSGTRLNSKLEDLGASITVVTKQQMADMGSLDINDVFRYEASTEGTDNF